MAVNLTTGAITMMCSDDSYSEDLKPVLQVIDSKLVQSSQENRVRYRLVLSDGSHYQFAMLAMQKNELVDSGRLQKGSVVNLTQFVCNVVQNRKIIIIIELDVLLEKCDLIGEPVPAQPQPASVHPKVNHPASNAHPTYPKSEPAGPLHRSVPFGGSYGDQNLGFRNPQSEASRPMQNSSANRGPVARDETPPRVISMATLNQHQNMWSTVLDIRCRCNFIFISFFMTFLLIQLMVLKFFW